MIKPTMSYDKAGGYFTQDGKPVFYETAREINLNPGSADWTQPGLEAMARNLDAEANDEPFFIAVTSSGNWGGGKTLDEAKKLAKWRKKERASFRRIIWTTLPVNLLTERDLDPRLNGGLTYEGYKAGDALRPWVTQYGDIVYKGVSVKIDADGNEISE